MIAWRHDRSSSVRNPPRGTIRFARFATRSLSLRRDFRLIIRRTVGLTRLTGAGYYADTHEKSVPASLGRGIRGGFARSMIQSSLMTAPPRGRAHSSTRRTAHLEIGRTSQFSESLGHAVYVNIRRACARICALLNTNYCSNLTANMTRLRGADYAKTLAIKFALYLRFRTYFSCDPRSL